MKTARVKPTFKVTQMMSATTASKRFGALRAKAQIEPQAILEHNEIDAVLLSYADYEAMYAELEALRAATTAPAETKTGFFGTR